MAKAIQIEDRTRKFVELHKRLTEAEAMITHEELAKLFGLKRKQSITEMLGLRQNIQQHQWEAFKERFEIEEEQPSTEKSVPRENGTAKNEIDYKDKYLTLLEKDNNVKDKTIDKLLLAVDKIKVVDDKVEKVTSTVYELKDKFEEFLPIVLGLREFVTDEIAALRKKSPESVAAALGIKVAEQRKKAAQPGIQQG